MNLSKKFNLIIYRFRERGLEVFLVNQDDEKWGIPEGGHQEPSREDHHPESDRFIPLDPVEQEDGRQESAWAVEGEWHDIPSLKAMLMEDASLLKEKLKEIDQGAFFGIKEAFKKVMPHQYAFLKELKDILTDRNSIKDL